MIYTDRKDDLGTVWLDNKSRSYGYLEYYGGYEVIGDSYKRRARGYLYKMKIGGFSDDALIEKEMLLKKSRRRLGIE